MASGKNTAFPKRGEVYLVNFDRTIGSEAKKTRAALVIQNNIGNRHSPITIVAAITSQFSMPLYPTEVLIKAPEGGLKTDSVALLNQIRSVDKACLTKLIGNLKPATLNRVNQALLISLGLTEV